MSKIEDMITIALAAPTHDERVALIREAAHKSTSRDDDVLIGRAFIAEYNRAMQAEGIPCEHCGQRQFAQSLYHRFGGCVQIGSGE